MRIYRIPFLYVIFPVISLQCQKPLSRFYRCWEYQWNISFDFGPVASLSIFLIFKSPLQLKVVSATSQVNGNACITSTWANHFAHLHRATIRQMSLLNHQAVFKYCDISAAFGIRGDARIDIDTLEHYRSMTLPQGMIERRFICMQRYSFIATVDISLCEGRMTQYTLLSREIPFIHLK